MQAASRLVRPATCVAAASLPRRRALATRRQHKQGTLSALPGLLFSIAISHSNFIITLLSSRLVAASSPRRRSQPASPPQPGAYRVVASGKGKHYLLCFDFRGNMSFHCCYCFLNCFNKTLILVCCLLICHFKEAAARGAGIQGEIGGGGGNKYVASSDGGNACRESSSVVMMRGEWWLQ